MGFLRHNGVMASLFCLKKQTDFLNKIQVIKFSRLKISLAMLFMMGCHERKETPAPLSQDIPDLQSTQNQGPPDGSAQGPNGFFPLGSQELGPLGDPWPVSEGSQKPEAKVPTGLLIATVDPLAMPWKAQVYGLSLGSDLNPEKLLSGESGDPIFRPIKDEIWMFNRSADSQNFRRLAPSFSPPSASFTMGSQLKFPGGVVGDPHDILRLGDLALMAHYNEGQLVLIDIKSQQEKGRIEAPWDLPEGVKLKPSSLVWSYDQDGQKTYVYVVHQALSIKDGVYGTNNTQQLFVLTYEPQNPTTPLTPVDLNPSLPKVQGIKLKGSFPVALKFYGPQKLLLVSMCSRFSLMNPPSDENPPCQSALEEVNLKEHSSQVVWDLGTLTPSYFMNGPVVTGKQDLSFFANVERQETPGKFVQVVAEFDVNKKSVREVYTFRPFSGGFWATFYEPSSQKLYVGDLGTQGAVGNLLVIDPQTPGEILKEIPLDGVPYSGSWVYP